jgi:hypothetical protein
LDLKSARGKKSGISTTENQNTQNTSASKDEEEFQPIYVNDEVINKPRTYHITSYMSIDAQYSMIKVYEDMMRRRLGILYPQRIEQAPIISAEAFYALCYSASSDEMPLNERNELIEKKIKKMSRYVEEGVRLLDMIDEYVLDNEKIANFHQETAVASAAAAARRNSNASRRSSIAHFVSSSKYAARHSDPLSIYTKWVNAWNKEYNTQ